MGRRGGKKGEGEGDVKGVVKVDLISCFLRRVQEYVCCVDSNQVYYY